MRLRTVHLKWGLLGVGAAAVVGLYIFLAYLVLPLTWRHYERQKALASVSMVTRTGDDIPGDPIKISVPVEGCNQRVASTAEPSNPPMVMVKNLAWNIIANLLRATPAAPAKTDD